MWISEISVTHSYLALLFACLKAPSQNLIGPPLHYLSDICTATSSSLQLLQNSEGQILLSDVSSQLSCPDFNLTMI